MRAHFGLPSVEKEEEEGRPPIGVKFEIPYFTVSGIQVREAGGGLLAWTSVGSPLSQLLARGPSVPWPGSSTVLPHTVLPLLLSAWVPSPPTSHCGLCHLVPTSLFTSVPSSFASHSPFPWPVPPRPPKTALCLSPYPVPSLSRWTPFLPTPTAMPHLCPKPCHLITPSL